MSISQTTSNEPWVNITFTTPENELTTTERAARERLLAGINQLMERFHEGTSDGVIEIEPYPCDDDCEHCEAEAA